ncbi:MAG: histidine kinase [Alkalispirochaeta sp.]
MAQAHYTGSIRNRIFTSYLILIGIIAIFVTLSGVARTVRVRIEEDRAAILELRARWGATRTRLGDMIINWDNGRGYEEFLEERREFAEQLDELNETIGRRRTYRDRVAPLLAGLQAVWATADAHLDRVAVIVDDPGFRLVEEMVGRQPGLQRLNHLRLQLVENGSPQARRSAHLIQRLITEVEFFPIYGDTLEPLLARLVAEAEELQRVIARAEAAGRVTFFVTFVLVSIGLSRRFSHALSRPIIDVTERVSSFAGLAGPVAPGATESFLPTGPDEHHGDEVSMLSATIDRMIEHYTELARRAGQLARGDVASDDVHFPREGVVGRSLEEIAEYLHELAHTSTWIREGEYGRTIRERSDADVITRNFNIMSTVINEKITTLRNMFEAVDEAVILVDSEYQVVEANSQFYELIGVTSGGDAIDERGGESDEGDDTGEERRRFISERIVPDLFAVVDSAEADGHHDHDGCQGDLATRSGQIVPIRVSLRELPGTEQTPRQWMFLITNESWIARTRREREQLQSQATVAELRALRAQIHPHFFFNTLNTISYLIETDTGTAVTTVQRLADLFRYTLTATKQERVPFSEELLYVRKYLEIEQLRYDKSLSVTYEIERGAEAIPFPPMLLQPLVENAVKYGSDDTGRIELSIEGRTDGDDFVVEVRDTGCSGTEPETIVTATGTGVRNVNQRLLTMFGHPLEVRKNRPRGLAIAVRVPWETVAESASGAANPTIAIPLSEQKGWSRE